MRYLALACDYDGTLATHGKVDSVTLAGLERLLASGRKLLMVTGRELDDLLAIFPHAELFEWIVAENGALLYHPATRLEKVLGERPPELFTDKLKERGVGPVSVGRVIVATWEPHENTVLETIRDLGLELQVIFNKGAVMVLPAGVNKATGLVAALEAMGLSPHSVVGVGDAENDHAFLSSCECAVAVANALPLVKERADIVTAGDHGAGVVELIDELIETDLSARAAALTRHHILLGTRADGQAVTLRPYGTNLLVAGTEGSGKSTLTTGLLERLAERKYQFCLIDPEGDYETFEGAVVLGSSQAAPTVSEVLQLLKAPGQNAIVNLLGVGLSERPAFFMTLLPRLLELRAQTGRPHWLVVDETHHLLPAAWEPALQALPQQIETIVRVTVHPETILPQALAGVNAVIAVGTEPEGTIRQYCAASNVRPPTVPSAELEQGEVLFWDRESGRSAFPLRPAPSRTERRRHIRKYAEGELPPDRSFYFRGPDGKLNLRAQNLILFLQLAEGVDDATWTYHLDRGDSSSWFREKIKDDALAAEAARVEEMEDVSPQESRAQIKAAVERRYTMPASAAGAAAK